MREMRRAISEYASAIMLAIIVLASGAAIYIYAMSVVNSSYQRIQNELMQAEQSMRQDIVISAAFISGSTLVAFLVAGDFPTKILGVYINETPATCTLYIGNSAYSLPATIPPYTLAVLKCPVSGTFAKLRVVYGGGEVVKYVKGI